MSDQPLTSADPVKDPENTPQQVDIQAGQNLFADFFTHVDRGLDHLALEADGKAGTILDPKAQSAFSYKQVPADFPEGKVNNNSLEFLTAATALKGELSPGYAEQAKAKADEAFAYMLQGNGRVNASQARLINGGRMRPGFVQPANVLL